MATQPSLHSWRKGASDISRLTLFYPPTAFRLLPTVLLAVAKEMLKSRITTEFVLKKGSELPMHKHPDEQAGYLVKGNIILYIDGVARNLKPGDSWNIGGNIEHKAEIVEDSVALEIFSPVREDYFKYVVKDDIFN